MDDALAAPESVLSTGEVRAQIVELSVQARRLDAKRLRLIGSLAGRKGPGAVAQFLQRATEVTAAHAHADVRAAALVETTSGDLRELGVALEKGTVSLEHVRVAAAASDWRGWWQGQNARA